MRWLAIVIAVAACGRGNFEVDADTDSPIKPADAATANNIAFVTSTTYDPSTFGTDLAGADAACAARATAGGLPGTYRAFLSTSSSAASSRFNSVARGWVRVDGRPFTDRIEDAITGKIYYPLAIDELGGVVPNDHVITGTQSDGTPSNETCDDYTINTSMYALGAPQTAATSWMSLGTTTCSTPGRLYCLGIDHQTPVTITPATGRIAFVTTQTYLPIGDLNGADALCTAEAAAQSLPGTYYALLDVIGASASSRYLLNGPPWVRLDGIQLADSTLAFMSGNLRAALNVNSSGTYVAGAVFTGGLFTTLSGSTSDDCTDWSSAGGNATVGSAEFVNSEFAVFGANTNCNPPLPIYCLQN